MIGDLRATKTNHYLSLSVKLIINISILIELVISHSNKSTVPLNRVSLRVKRRLVIVHQAEVASQGFSLSHLAVLHGQYEA